MVIKRTCSATLGSIGQRLRINNLSTVRDQVVATVVGSMLFAIVSVSLAHITGFATIDEALRWFRSMGVEAPSDKLSIVIADFEGDTDLKTTGLVARSLKDQKGFSVIRLGRVLAVDDDRGDQAAAFDIARIKSRETLNQIKGDVLIWGEVFAGEVELRFLTSEDRLPASLAGKDAIELLVAPNEIKFSEATHDLGIAMLIGSILPEIFGSVERPGAFLTDVARPTAEKLGRFIENMPSELESVLQADLRFIYGGLNTLIGVESGEKERIERAIEEFQIATSLLSRSMYPDRLARTKFMIGHALLMLNLMGGTQVASIDKAIDSVEESLSIPDGHSASDRRTAQATLGMLLALKGQTLRERELLVEGLSILEASLPAIDGEAEVFTVEDMVIQQQVSSAEFFLGGMSLDSIHLRRALERKRELSRRIDKDRHPLFWFGIQISHSLMLSYLADREDSAEKFEEASSLALQGLSVVDRERMPHLWANAKLVMAWALVGRGNRDVSYAADAIPVLLDAMDDLPPHQRLDAISLLDLHGH